ncbi:hypothetical protein JTB14_025718 [Gonioctena quinquepunctata]|nr:hypothetical protein JTB14_025718 [Gonioctena quinquepunctata]
MCTYCQGKLAIYTCDKFLNLTLTICANCLREKYHIGKCRIGPCKRCKSRHNSLLHDDIRPVQPNETTDEQSSANVLSSGAIQCSIGQTILSTARVLISDNFDQFHSVRALLDCGSQTSFITEQLQRKLNVISHATNLAIYGITNNISSVKGKCNVALKSQVNQFSIDSTCYILPEITSRMPSIAMKAEILKIQYHIVLADPEFHRPGPVDMLIGADLFWQLLGTNKIILGRCGPYLQETKLAWKVSGPLGVSNPKTTSCNFSRNQELLQALTKFWEIEEMSDHKWWKGPYWLSGDQSKWPNEQPEAGSMPELKSQAYLAGQFESTLDFPFEKFSSFNKLRNVIAYILRFEENCLKTGNDRRKGDLTPQKLNRATKTLIKTCQYQCFSSDIENMKEGNELRSSNKLSGLTPFLDSEGILRVGGRLKYSDYDFDKRHPILLPGKHQLTKLIFHQEHNRLLHAGPQLLLSTMRDTYWPISARDLASDIVRKCVRCFRFRTSTNQPIMPSTK